MGTEENYDDIISMERPWPERTLQKHPKMALQDRAKIFAPFAALRGHSERLGEEDVKLRRCHRTELSDEEAEILSDKLMQVKKGMTVTVVYFQPDTDAGDWGYIVTITGVVSSVDSVYRVLNVNTGRRNEKGPIDEVIRFNDLLDVNGEGIAGINGFPGFV